MSGSPIATWEGAEAYFTFADSPTMIALMIVLTIGSIAYTVFRMAWHETHIARNHR